MTTTDISPTRLFPWLPEGRGMFIQSLQGLSPKRTVRQARRGRLTWVAVQVLWQGRDVSRTYNYPHKLCGLARSYGCTARGARVIDALREAGVAVIPFAYPVPGRTPERTRELRDEVVDVLEDVRDAWGSPAVLLDPEAEWVSRWGKHRGAARGLAAAMTAAFPSWGMTSFGAPWYHRGFPWRAFSSADWAVPQTYDGQNNMGPRYVERSHAAYRKLGYDHGDGIFQRRGYGRLVGAVGTYRKTANQFEALVEQVGRSGVQAMIGWKLRATAPHELDIIARAALAPGLPSAVA